MVTSIAAVGIAIGSWIATALTWGNVGLQRAVSGDWARLFDAPGGLVAGSSAAFVVGFAFGLLRELNRKDCLSVAVRLVLVDAFGTALALQVTGELGVRQIVPVFIVLSGAGVQILTGAGGVWLGSRMKLKLKQRRAPSS